MTWWQFSLNCQSSELEQIEGLMLELGALSISLSDAGDEPLYEPLPGDQPLWQKSNVTATFDIAIDHKSLYRQLTNSLPEHLTKGIRQKTLHDRDWDQAYKQHFQPIRCAPDLWVVPSWSEPPDPEATIIQLDPGLAFGTGSHPTTALCLAWMGKGKLEQRQVVDYGCGSGILAIAAIKLGANHVTAVDIDQQALTACRSNMALNDIGSEQIKVMLPSEMVPTDADLLIANILAEPLKCLVSQFAKLVKPGGQILLSGILKTQQEALLLAYRPFSKLDPASYRDEWACISGTRLQRGVHV